MLYSTPKTGLFIFLSVLLILVQAGMAATQTTTLKDQQSVAITIYNSNIGLVKETRLVHLQQGVQALKFMDVAGKIDPTTVKLNSLLDGTSLRILEQNYEYDLANQQKLVEKFVGQKVELAWSNPESKKEEMVEATLLSTQGGNTFQIGDKIFLGHPGRIILSKIPETVSLQPTLLWLLENRLSGPQRLEVMYLTSGINWKTDYLTVLNSSDTQVELTGWVTIENRSGAAYRNAQLRLVAGEAQRVRQEKMMERAAPRMAGEGLPSMAAAPQFKEESFFEYHLYALDRGTTLQDNETKQMVLFDAHQVPVSRLFILQGQPQFYWSRYEAKGQKQKVGVFLELVNRQENHLGIPLPKGTVRVYKADKDGTLQFAGEDWVDHTAKNERFKIKIGEAFDVAAERIQTEYKHLDSKIYEVAFEVELRNQKSEDVRVLMEEPIPGDWEMISNSHPYEKLQANLIRFLVPVEKNQAVKVKYKVRFRY